MIQHTGPALTINGATPMTATPILYTALVKGTIEQAENAARDRAAWRWVAGTGETKAGQPGLDTGPALTLNGRVSPRIR